MGADASLPLQAAVNAALVADATLRSLIPDFNDVFDEVPPDRVKPYISFGPEQVLPFRGQDTDGSDIALQLDAWSAGPGRVECKQICDAIRTALDRASLQLGDGQRVVNLEIEQTRYLREVGDTRTWHGVVIFRVITAPA